MLNLMNFEWKKSWKAFVLGIVSVLIVYTYLAFQGIEKFNQGELDVVIAMVILISLLSIGSAAVLFHSISFLSTDVKDKGYLIFSTPNSAWKILGAKLAVVFIRFFLWGLMVASIFFHMMGSLKIPELQSALMHNIPQVLLLIMVSAAASLFFTMTIYFLISLTATVLSGWKYPVLLVIMAYFGLAYVVDKIAVKLGELVSLPVTFQWNMPMIDQMNGFSVTGAMSYSAQGAVFNIAPILFYMVIGVGYFMAAGYLLDRKLNI